jgi:hypothetical protein
LFWGHRQTKSEDIKLDYNALDYKALMSKIEASGMSCVKETNSDFDSNNDSSSSANF